VSECVVALVVLLGLLGVRFRWMVVWRALLGRATGAGDVAHTGE